MAIFVTGDIHSEIYPRFNTKNFSAQKELTKDDIVIVCGDFGIPFVNNKTHEHALKELGKRPFTTAFIDGNHENFDILNSYPVEEWNGGKVHKLNDSVIHLMRSQVFNIQNHKFFTFGGAPSHDIQDGIIENDENMKQNVRRMQHQHKHFYRINHISWWKEEVASQEEFDEGIANLEKHNFKVDFILTHEAPQTIRRQMHYYDIDPQPMAEYLQNIKQRTGFKRWYFGHYHVNQPFYWDRTIAIYDNIEQIV